MTSLTQMNYNDSQQDSDSEQFGELIQNAQQNIKSLLNDNQDEKRMRIASDMPPVTKDFDLTFQSQQNKSNITQTQLIYQECLSSNLNEWGVKIQVVTNTKLKDNIQQKAQKKLPNINPEKDVTDNLIPTRSYPFSAFRSNKNPQSLSNLKSGTMSLQQKQQKSPLAEQHTHIQLINNPQQDSNTHSNNILNSNKSDKTKKIEKKRFGKHHQSQAQKYIKKFSLYHYNKNFKQDLQKILKKLNKKKMPLTKLNILNQIKHLEKQINKNYTQKDKKPTQNKKGVTIDPKKFYDSYHGQFKTELQKKFIEQLFQMIFRQTYKIMYESQQRLKLLTSNQQKIESQIPQNDSQMVEESNDEDSQQCIQQGSKNVQKSEQSNKKQKKKGKKCLDQIGQEQLQDLFQKQYEAVYKSYNVKQGNNNPMPNKQQFMMKIKKYCLQEIK